MVRACFIVLLLATPCYFQHAVLAASPVLNEATVVNGSDSLDKTIDEMVKKTGLTLSDDQLGLVKNMASGNFHAKTLTKMMGSMAGDVKKDQKEEFNDFANRVVGWKRKKETIQNKMILELANGTTDAKNMRAYMKNMNLNAIINTVQKTYSGSPEWDRIKAFVDRVNKDPHGWRIHFPRFARTTQSSNSTSSFNLTTPVPNSNKTTTVTRPVLTTTVNSNTSTVTTVSPSSSTANKNGSNPVTTTPPVQFFTFVFVPLGNVTSGNVSTNSGPSWNSIMSMFTSPSTNSTSLPVTTNPTTINNNNMTTITPRLSVSNSSITSTNLTSMTPLPPVSILSNSTNLPTSHSTLTLLPTANSTLLPSLTTVTFPSNTTGPSTGIVIQPSTPSILHPPPPTTGTPLVLPTNGTVSTNIGSNITTVLVSLTTPGHGPVTTMLPTTNTTGPTLPSVSPQNSNASPVHS